MDLLRQSLKVVVMAASLLATLGTAGTGNQLERYMAVLGVSLGESTGDQARRRLGAGTVVHNGGDAGDSMNHLCYRGSDGTTLLFTCWECSRNPFGADEYQLAARASLVKYADPQRHYRVPAGFDPNCTATRALSAATSVGALRLGMKRSVVVAALGQPVREASDRLEYEARILHLTIDLEGGRIVVIHGARWWE